jgi:hypothetical protein
MKEQHLRSGNNTTYETAKLYTINNTVVVKDKYDWINLNVKIQVDLSEVDEKYHEIFVNVLTSKYMGVASFGDNPFSLSKSVNNKQWWEIWK